MITIGVSSCVDAIVQKAWGLQVSGVPIHSDSKDMTLQ